MEEDAELQANDNTNRSSSLGCKHEHARAPLRDLITILKMCVLGLRKLQVNVDKMSLHKEKVWKQWSREALSDCATNTWQHRFSALCYITKGGLLYPALL